MFLPCLMQPDRPRLRVGYRCPWGVAGPGLRHYGLGGSTGSRSNTTTTAITMAMLATTAMAYRPVMACNSKHTPPKNKQMSSTVAMAVKVKDNRPAAATGTMYAAKNTSVQKRKVRNNSTSLQEAQGPR